ncbi:hypothetical protein SEUCBS139899_006582 [Sporothrix eucalyptigena]
MSAMDTPNLTPASAETDHSDPETGTAGSSPTTKSSSAPRSCLPCKAKKIRCDKRQPCQGCVRAGRACTYPPAGPRLRRTKKSMMAAMAARISELEKELKLTKVTKSPSKAVIQQTKECTPVAPTTSSSANSGKDILVQDGSSSQYFNEVLLSRVMADDDGLGHSLLSAAQSPASTPTPTLSPFNALGILSSPSPLPPARLHPTKAVAVRLWTLFLERVDGCSGLKLLHVPTDQVRVFGVINDPTGATYDSLALCFSIYYGARVASDEEEGKENDLLQYKVGLEQSLAHGDFLDRPTLTGLLALAIYLAALRFCNRGKGLWVLNGLAVRVAQSLGLHRDGGKLRLSPFEAEIRRRLWWHLVSRDGRASEDYGLEGASTPGLLEAEVLLPLNVDDQDLAPDMKERPPSKQGWTGMTFSLIHIALCRAAQRLAVTGGECSSESVRASLISELRADIEHQLALCNMDLPQQRMTILCSKFLLRKLDFVSRLQWAIRRGDKNGLVSDANLVEALAILRPRLFREDDLLLQYAWARKAYPQYHVAMYVLWHLCRQPTGPHVEEAWSAVGLLFQQEDEMRTHGGLGSKFAVLAALQSKAEARRQHGSSTRCVGSPSVTTIPSLATGTNVHVPVTSPSVVFNDFLLDSDMLDFGLDDVWSAWSDEQPMLL